MLELLIAAFFQISVLTSGTAPTTTTTTPTSNTTIKASAAPTVSTNIGTSGWDDRN